MSSMPHSTTSHHHHPGLDEAIVGVDTHKDVHVAAAINTLGVLLGTSEFSATAAGYEQLLSWASAFGMLRQAGVEGTGSYGAALSRHLRAAGIEVIEVNQPDKATRRKQGKTDAIDAQMAAQAVLSRRATAVAKTNDGPVDMLRMYKNARSSAVKARTQAINQLKAILVRADPQLREQLTGLSNRKLFHACAVLTVTGDTSPLDAAIYTLRSLAQRIQNLTYEINDLMSRIDTVVKSSCPELLERDGVGPDSAATLLIASGDNPERLRSEASFAALCGASPIEASSGKIRRHRLNRGGDRQANRALHTIVLTRLRCNDRAKSYMDQRIAAGKTRNEAIRCLKRYAARELYALIIKPLSEHP